MLLLCTWLSQPHLQKPPSSARKASSHCLYELVLLVVHLQLHQDAAQGVLHDRRLVDNALAHSLRRLAQLRSSFMNFCTKCTGVMTALSNGVRVFTQL